MTGCNSQYMSVRNLHKQAVAFGLCLWVPVCATSRGIDCVGMVRGSER